MNLPFSQACENNKQPILSVIKPLFEKAGQVVEIGSGTGQHAEYFAAAMPNLLWQPTDRMEYLPGLKARREQSGLKNFLSPLELDVNHPWPMNEVENTFTANTLHIMSWVEVQNLFDALGRHLLVEGFACFYGPFNYQGRYTSGSNARFDEWLKERDANSAIRDFEALNRLAESAGMRLKQDVAMPANNRCLVFRKVGQGS